jgi:hypothetical protein
MRAVVHPTAHGTYRRSNKEIILAFLPESTQSENLLRTLLEQELSFLGQTEMRNLTQAERKVPPSAAAAATAEFPGS